MTAEIRSELEWIATEVHAVLLSCDPAQAREEWAARMRTRADTISRRVHALQARIAAERDNRIPDELLLRLQERLDEVRRHRAESSERFHQECRRVRERLQPSYAALVDVLRTYAVRVPNFRPTNLHRTVFHLLSGLLGLVTIQWVLVTESLYHWVPLILPLTFWSLEISRRYSRAVNQVLMRALGKMAHAHEWTRVNSGTWYGTALAILAWTVEPWAASVAVMVLATADPAASLVGRRFGKLRFKGGKSLEGMIAFWVVASFVGWAVILGVGPRMAFWDALVLASGAGVLAAVAEALSGRMDDNFSIPLSAGWACTLIASGMGV